MSLLRDALGTGKDAKAEHDKETQDSLSFSGPVLDADDLLGGTKPALESESPSTPDDVSTGNREPIVNQQPVRENEPSVNETVPVDFRVDEPSTGSLTSVGETRGHPAPAPDSPSATQATDQHSSIQQTSQQPAYAAVSDEPASVVNAPRRSINPDPLFFMIIAFACVALFGSVYALVTQNDEFVSREYAELRARQNNLEALIARQQQQLTQSAAVAGTTDNPGNVAEPTELVNDGNAGVVAESAVGAPVDTEVHAKDKSVTEAVSAVTESASPASETSEQHSATALADPSPNSTSPTVPAGTSLAVTAASAPTAGTVSNDSVPITTGITTNAQQASRDPQLVLLQQELDALRETIAGQNKMLSQLLAERAVEGRDSGSDQSAAAPSVSAPVRSDAAASDGGNTPSSAPVYDKAGDVTIVEQQQTTVVAGDRSQAQEIRLPSQGNAEYVDGGFAALIGQAFHAYSTGNMPLAGTLYRRALQLEPYNRDANLGVAAVATDAGDFAEATQRYRHLLSLNPGDEVAFSGALNLVELSGNRAIENEMIVHTSQYRQMPVLHASLGNYFSRQLRWDEARQSYATAAGLAPDTADYLYNLAVSLDQLGNTTAAIENYQRAMTLSATGHHSFDSITVSSRLQSLKASQP